MPHLLRKSASKTLAKKGERRKVDKGPAKRGFIGRVFDKRKRFGTLFSKSGDNPYLDSPLVAAGRIFVRHNIPTGSEIGSLVREYLKVRGNDMVHITPPLKFNIRRHKFEPAVEGTKGEFIVGVKSPKGGVATSRYFQVGSADAIYEKLFQWFQTLRK